MYFFNITLSKHKFTRTRCYQYPDLYDKIFRYFFKFLQKMDDDGIATITEDTINKISISGLTEAEKAMIIDSAPGCESMINEVLGLSVQNVSVVRAWLICIEFVSPSE